MKRLFNYVKSVNLALNILLLISILTVITIKFYLSNIPERFDGAAELGDIIVNLSIAFIASYVFYFIVVHLKTINDKKNVNLYVNRKTNYLIVDCKKLISELRKESEFSTPDEYPNKSETEEICKRINPFSDAPLLISAKKNKANWIQYFDYYKNRAKENIRDIFILLPYLDSQYVKHIYAIQDCLYFRIIGFIKGLQINNTDLTAFSGELLEYFGLINELEIYYNKSMNNKNFEN